MNPQTVAAKKIQDVTPLIETLGHEDADLREQAAEALGQIGDVRAVQPLIELLEDDDWFVREKVVEALGKLRDKRAVKPLIQALGDDDWFVREKAVEALGEIRDPRAAGALAHALKDQDMNVRTNALGALRKIGEPAVEPLVTALVNNDIPDRASVVEAIGRIGGKSAVMYLIDALEDLDHDVRSAARRALRKLDIKAEDVI